jgi:hypothetical protein
VNHVVLVGNTNLNNYEGFSAENEKLLISVTFFLINVSGNTWVPSRYCFDFDKINKFCDKCYVCIDKYVFIIVKIKCMNSDRISDICKS